MSVVDPRIAQEARKMRRAKGPGVVPVIVVLLLLFVGGAVAGAGWGNPELFTMDSDADPTVWMVLAVPLGMILSISSLISWTFVVIKRGRGGLGFGWAALLFGGAAGVNFSSSSSPFVQPGNSSYALASEILSGLGALALLLALFAMASRRRARSVRDKVMSTGTLTTATVSDKGYDRFRESNRILITVTFTFRDATGIQRWVRKPMMIHSSAPLENGDETKLWYDATQPGNVKRIVVEAALKSPGLVK
jgi:hypothetical protein